MSDSSTADQVHNTSVSAADIHHALVKVKLSRMVVGDGTIEAPSQAAFTSAACWCQWHTMVAVGMSARILVGNWTVCC